MPLAVDATDRKLLLIMGAVMLVLLVATALLSPPASPEFEMGQPSTYSTAPGGTQAAYLLLRDLGYDAERWELPPTELPVAATGKLLILADPSNLPDRPDREALRRFVQSGGWIIFTASTPSLFFDGALTKDAPFEAPALSVPRFPATIPSSITRGAPEITLDRDDRWVITDASQLPVYGKSDSPVVISWQVGQGRILWWSAPTPLTNAGISSAGNLTFFLNCIRAAAGSDDSIPFTIWWDEYFHGYRGSLWNYFQKTPVPWALWQAGLLALFILFEFARHSGPIYTPVTASRLSPLEFVDTMGSLYQRAGAASGAVSVAYQRFRSQLTRRLSLSAAASNLTLDTAVRERLGWKQPGLFATLQLAEKAARTADLSAADALKLVQAIEHYQILLGLKTVAAKEKH